MTEEELRYQIEAIDLGKMRPMFKAFSDTAQKLGFSPLQATTIIIMHMLSSGFPVAESDIIMMLKRLIASYESPDNPYLNYKPERN